MARFLLVLVTAAVVAPDARGQSYGYFPPVRSHGDLYLRASFRLPIEALLESDTPGELAQRSTGSVPTLAATPAKGRLTDPFAAVPVDSGTDTDAELLANDTDPFAGEAPAEAAPADTAADSTDPFASSQEASADPFAGEGDADGASDEDPFAFPADGDAGDADSDPFADF